MDVCVCVHIRIGWLKMAVSMQIYAKLFVVASKHFAQGLTFIGVCMCLCMFIYVFVAN